MTGPGGLKLVDSLRPNFPEVFAKKRGEEKEKNEWHCSLRFVPSFSNKYNRVSLSDKCGSAVLLADGQKGTQPATA